MVDLLHPQERFRALLLSPEPLLALAPMQDISGLPFWQLVDQSGGPDLYVTEYFRVHPVSRPEKSILRSVTNHAPGRVVVAQMIGNDIPALVRTAKELQHFPVAAIDLNLGCPAPVVCKKCAGGGLLREPGRVHAILGALREAVTIPFTVKTRIGFDAPDRFEELLAVFSRHSLDLVTVHGRTVLEMYQGPVHYDLIRRAVETLPCPVLANGNVFTAQNAAEVLRLTGARGLMIGRGAVGNPWVFRQIRQVRRGEPLPLPMGREVLGYIRRLYDAVCSPQAPESSQVQRMKKFLVYLGAGVDPEGRFLRQIRRVTTRAELFRVCEVFLNHDEPMSLAPFPGEQSGFAKRR